MVKRMSPVRTEISTYKARVLVLKAGSGAVGSLLVSDVSMGLLYRMCELSQGSI